MPSVGNWLDFIDFQLILHARKVDKVLGERAVYRHSKGKDWGDSLLGNGMHAHLSDPLSGVYGLYRGSRDYIWSKFWSIRPST